jgi:hypothetical protein
MFFSYYIVRMMISLKKTKPTTLNSNDVKTSLWGKIKGS